MPGSENRRWWIGGGLLLGVVLLVMVVLPKLLLPGDPEPEALGASDSAGVAPQPNGGAGRAGSGVGREGGIRFERRPQALSKLANPTSEQCLRALAGGAEEEDRVLAARLLGQRADEEGLAERAVPALITAMQSDAKPQVWLVAARALGLYGPAAAESVPLLQEWMDHGTMGDIAVEALGRIGPVAESSAESIKAIALDPELRTSSRSKAITALVQIRGVESPEMIAIGRQLTKDADPVVHQSFREARKEWLDARDANPQGN